MDIKHTGLNKENVSIEPSKRYCFEYSAQTPFGKNFMVPSEHLFDYLTKHLVFIDFVNQNIS